MKIIKTGKLVEEVSIYTGTCKKCGCVVGCDKEELKTKYETFGVGLTGHYDVVEYVVCPTHGCSSHIVPSRKIFR